MAAEPLILNPIGWVQAQLLGGWRKQLAICGAYAGAVLLFCVLIYRMVRDTTSVPAFCSAALVALSTRGKVAITGLLIVLGILANARVVDILPGLALLVPATVISKVRNTQLTGADSAALILSMLAQLALAMTFYLAASRKF